MRDAPKDALTKALARDTLDVCLREALEQSRLEQSPVALLLVDVDYLKLMNDAFGHRAGDGVLVTVADTLHAYLNEGDLLFRYGGDEFVVILPQTSLEVAFARASDILASVKATPYLPDIPVLSPLESPKSAHSNTPTPNTPTPNIPASQAHSAAGCESSYERDSDAASVPTDAVVVDADIVNADDADADDADTGNTDTGNTDMAVRRPQVTLSLSIGVADMTVATDAYDLEALAQYLFEEADQRLYVAKRAGRGQVCDGSGQLESDETTIDVRLLGREDALEQVRRFLATPVTAIVTPALTVRGHVGMGVSRLLKYAQTLAQLMADVVVTLKGSMALRERKLGALSEAHLSVPWLEWADLIEPLTVQRKLAENAPEGHLLIMVDRIDLLDEASRHYLHNLLALTMPTRLVYSVLSEHSQRSGDGASDLRKFVEIQDTITLAALSFDDVMHWLQGRLGEQLSPVTTPSLRQRQPVHQQDFVRGIYDLTRGVPARVSIVLTALELGLVTRTDPLEQQLATLTSLLDEKTRRSSLPMSRSVFVGRYQEIATLKRWLRSGALISVVGADGMGKSRLTLQAARECAANFLGDVYWLSMTSLTSYNQLLYSLAEAMHVPFGSSQDPDAPVFGVLRQAPTLLVLDDVTVLTPVLELISNIQQHAPATALCITSQVSLKLASERVLQLQALPQPSVGHPALNGSVVLFLEYARQAAPNRYFQASDEHFLQALQHIYEYVSATPLGLELAAAWCGVYDVPAIAALLQTDALRLEDAPEADAAGASVQVMLEAFWSLLSAHEQQVFASLAVFASDFSEEAAKDVAGASPFFLTSLWHKSVLSHRVAGNRSDDGRYSLPLLLRQFAAAKLAAQPHWQQQAQQTFIRYYLAWLKALEPALWDNRQRRTFELLHNDIDNITKAWRWLPSFDAAIPGGAVALDPHGKATMLLRNYFEVKGHARQGAELFAELSAYFAPVQARFASFHTYAEARLWFRAGAVDLSRQAIRRARGLLERSIEPPEGFSELPWLSILEATNALFAGDLAQVPVDLDVALGEAARLGAQRTWLSAYITLAAWHYEQDDLVRAQQILRRAEVMARRLGARVELCRCLHYQGALYLEQGTWQQAKRTFKIGLERANSITFNRSQALCCIGLARCLSQSNAIAIVDRPLASHRLQKMHRHLEHALHYVERSGSTVELLQVLRERLSLAYATGDVASASEDLGRALTIASNTSFLPSRLQLLAVVAWHHEGLRAEVLVVIYRHPAASEYFRRKLREQFGEMTWSEERLAAADAQRQLTALHDVVLSQLPQLSMARAS